MRRRWQKYPPISDVEWVYPDTTRVMEALVKSALYDSTKQNKSEDKQDEPDTELGAPLEDQA